MGIILCTFLFNKIVSSDNVTIYSVLSRTSSIYHSVLHSTKLIQQFHVGSEFGQMCFCKQLCTVSSKRLLDNMQHITHSKTSKVARFKLQKYLSLFFMVL